MPTIALVDDDRNILTSVSIALEAEGYRIQTYTDGASALDGLRHAPPDLAIFDIKMPRMDGMDLLQRLRQRSSMPVILLTSKDDEIDEVLGLRMGADDYVKKPFSQRLLVERIRAARPDIALSGDFIVGFPGETDADFEATLQLVEAVGYATAFAFKYSARPGTPAAARTIFALSFCMASAEARTPEWV